MTKMNEQGTVPMGKQDLDMIALGYFDSGPGQRVVSLGVVGKGSKIKPRPIVHFRGPDAKKQEMLMNMHGLGPFDIHGFNAEKGLIEFINSNGRLVSEVASRFTSAM